MPESNKTTPMNQETAINEKKKFSFSSARERLIIVYKTFVRGVFTLVVLIALYNVLHDFNVNRLVFEPFSVAVSLEEKGYTGKEIASRISDKVNSIRNSVKKHIKIYKTVQTGGKDDEIPEFEVPGANISLHMVMQYLRAFFGVSDDRVTGSVVSGKELYMTIRITNQPSVTYTGEKGNMEKLVEQAAAHVLMQLEPFSLALYYNEQEDIPALEEMITVMSKNSSDDSEKITIHIINSFILTLKKNYAASVIEAERAVNINPEHSYALHNYSIALVDSGQLSDATAVMQQLIEVSPNWSTFNNMAYVEMMLSEYKPAVEHVKKSIAMYPDCEQCYDTWGSILFRQKQYDQAIEKIQQAMDFSLPDQFAYYFYLMGDIHTAATRKQDAKKSYIQATRADKNGKYGKLAQLKLDQLGKETKNQPALKRE